MEKFVLLSKERSARICTHIFYLIGKYVLSEKKPSGKDAHEFVWKMYCVPNSALKSVEAHWKCVMSRSVPVGFVLT